MKIPSLKRRKDFVELNHKGYYEAGSCFIVKSLFRKAITEFRPLERQETLREGRQEEGQARLVNDEGKIIGKALEREDFQGISPMVGITITKKISKKAVVRNRIRRRIREILRQYILSLMRNSVNYQIIVRKNIAEESYLLLAEQLTTLFAYVHKKMDRNFAYRGRPYTKRVRTKNSSAK